MDYRASAEAPKPDRSVLVIGLNGNVFGLARDTGEIRWRYDGGGTGEVFIAVGYGVVVVSSNDATIACLDYLTGAPRWVTRTRAGGRATILIEPEQIVCAKNGYIDCFAPNGTPLWQQPLEGAGLGGTALGYPGNVAQADDRGNK